MDPISDKALASASPVGAADIEGLNGVSDGAKGAAKTGGSSFGEVMEATKARGAAGPEPAPQVQAAAEAQPAEPAAKRLDDFLRSVSADQEAMDRAMEKAMRGDAMDSGELLRLQATMYSYAQKIDISTKIVEKTTGGLKQMMNTQV